MAAPLSVSIVHPQSIHLKKISPLLHFLAGLVFISDAYSDFMDDNRITAFSEFIIGADVIAIAFIKRFAEESSRLNAWFRFIEVVVFTGIGILALLNAGYIFSSLFFVVASLYAYIFYCERKLILKEKVEVHHLGVTISSFPNDQHIDWEQIEAINALPHSIAISTKNKKTYHFNFEKGIALSELEQIHEFCDYYLK